MPRSPFTVRDSTDSYEDSAAQDAVPLYVTPLSRRYIVPTVDGKNNGYSDVPAPVFATPLNVSPDGTTPDALRIGQQPSRTYRPAPDKPPARWWRHTRADTIARDRVNKVDGNGWRELQPGRKGVGPNPRWTPRGPFRPTSKLAPRSYTMTRPWDKAIAARFTGEHFSMADHRRNFDVLGMRPAPGLRGTVRYDPPAWDTELVDEPPTPDHDAFPRALRSPDRSVRRTRSYRLGG